MSNGVSMVCYLFFCPVLKIYTYTPIHIPIYQIMERCLTPVFICTVSLLDGDRLFSPVLQDSVFRLLIVLCLCRCLPRIRCLCGTHMRAAGGEVCDQSLRQDWSFFVPFFVYLSTWNRDPGGQPRGWLSLLSQALSEPSTLQPLGSPLPSCEAHVYFT